VPVAKPSYLPAVRRPPIQVPATLATTTAIANQTGETSVTATAPAEHESDDRQDGDVPGGPRRCQRCGDVAADDREREPVREGQREHPADIETVAALLSY
jgi:hypothetical protein